MDYGEKNIKERRLLNTCLFNAFNANCSNIFSEEHIIQEGLGGTLKSKEITCKSCNQYFGNSIDPVIVNYYRPILEIIAPVLSGDLKRKVRKLRSLNGEEGLKIHSGGYVEKNDINKKYDEKGQIVEIIASSTIEREQIEVMAQKKAETYERCLNENAYFIDLKVTDSLLRAIVLNLLRLIKYVCVKNSLSDFLNHSRLNDLKGWVRKGTPANYIPTKYLFPFASISDIIDRMFDACVFSHKLIVFFDCEKKRILFAAEFLNTMPWMIILENLDLFATSFLIKYQKKLVTDEGKQEEPEIIQDFRLDWGEINWSKFSTATLAACNHAWLKFKLKYIEQIGRAQYEIDMRHDDALLKNIKLISLNYEESKIIDKVPEIISDLIVKNRYRFSPFVDEIKEICYQKAQSICFSRKLNQKSQMDEIVSIYRSCLKMIVDNSDYGYPQQYRL